MAGKTPPDGKNPFIGRGADDEIDFNLRSLPQRIGPLVIKKWRWMLLALRAARADAAEWKKAYGDVYKKYQQVLHDLPED